MSTGIVQSQQIQQARPADNQIVAGGRYISLSSEDVINLLRFIRTNYADGNRELNHVATRPLSQAKAPICSNVPEIKAEMLGSINQPQFDRSAPPDYQQMAGNLTLLKALMCDPRIQQLVDQALQENQLLGAK